MKRSHLLFLTTATGVALLLLTVSALPGNSDPALAAPRPDRDSSEAPPGQNLSAIYQADEISCVLTITTTDSLNNSNACPVGADPEACAAGAVTLADYANLALVAQGTPGDELAAHTDWFRLDNAQIGALYTIEALPNLTTNYNLGIIVYDSDLAPILSDENPVDDNRARVVLQAETQGPYFFQIFQISPACSGGTYDLETSYSPPAATSTPPAAPPVDGDDYEPNDTFEQAPVLPIQVPIDLELTFHSTADVNFFQFYTKSNRWYQASTSDLIGVDTVLEIYNRDQTRIARDADSAGGFASRVSWRAEYDGYYYVVVRNSVASTGSYALTLTGIDAPTPGPTPTAPALRARADDCEPNPNFEHACIIPLDQDLTFNFVPPFGQGPDNDFYRLWIKPGLHYRCQTSDLDPGVDPNMIMFRGPSWDAAIAGNDDIAPCDLNSALTFYSDYTGWLYILIGYGDRTPPDITNSSYVLRCEKSTTPFLAPSTPPPTAESDPPGKLPTPAPTGTPTTPESPIATPTPGTDALSVRPLTTPAPPTSSAPRFLPVSLLVYYDTNDDGQPGAGEGIAGISAKAYDTATSELLAEDYTDAQGSLTFSVSAHGPVRLSIPFLGLSRLFAGEEASLQVRIPPYSQTGGAP